MDRLPAWTAEHPFRATRNSKMDVTTIYWDTAAQEAAAASKLRPRARFHSGRARKSPLRACLHLHPSGPGTSDSSQAGSPAKDRPTGHTG